MRLLCRHIHVKLAKLKILVLLLEVSAALVCGLLGAIITSLIVIATVAVVAAKWVNCVKT